MTSVNASEPAWKAPVSEYRLHDHIITVEAARAERNRLAALARAYWPGVCQRELISIELRLDALEGK